MDVLRRHRLLVTSGCVAALALALLSVVRVSSSGLAYRSPEVWSNAATLVLSQESFPEGRSVLPSSAQPDRYSGLVDQYAALATSDAVIASLKRQHLLKPEAGDRKAAPITAAAVASTVTGAPTPLLKITAKDASPAAATRLTIRATDTFIAVVRSRQAAAKIPENQRFELRIVTRAGVPTLTGPRSKTTPIIILLAGLTIVIAAAFMRDNLQRGRWSQSEPPSVLDRLVREAEPAASAESAPVYAAAERVSRTGTNDADGEPNVGSVSRSRWSARSSG